MIFYRYREDRRCTLYHLWRKNHGGEERSIEVVLKSRGIKEGCKNEVYIRPEDGIPFVGRGRSNDVKIVIIGGGVGDECAS